MARKKVKPETRVKIISAAASTTASKCYLGQRAGLNKVGGGVGQLEGLAHAQSVSTWGGAGGPNKDRG